MIFFPAIRYIHARAWDAAAIGAIEFVFNSQERFKSSKRDNSNLN